MDLSMEDPDEPDGSTVAGLLDLLSRQVELLKAVATGGPGVPYVQEEYQRRRAVMNAGLKRLGIEPPFPWTDLWRWYGAYKDVEGGYSGRRAHIDRRATPVYEKLERLLTGAAVTDPGPATTGWPDLNQRLDGLHNELLAAESLDDLQDVGRRAREILIDLAAQVYEPTMLPAGVPEQPKAGDAKAMLRLASNPVTRSSE